MNKKFLSAILFGALMATSAGTFVSCKDYDDDIKNLQTQIDTNKTAIAELQKLVGAGNWVTNVAASGESLVVTMSNGTTATIAGIKGADGKDGKNAAEWTIGEDGFWYVNGEKTANVAVAQNGKDGVNGLTAPSPKIENGVWVVYNWDAEKGEFVEEVTEISAAGTSAYVVLKDGAYILNIADENGEFVEVSLPATAESFTINGIGNTNVMVQFAYGEWKAPSTRTEKELFAKLAAEFPELEEYEEGQFVEQGGKLPFIVSPANVELTKDHSFALVNMKGVDAGATLSNPTKGMPEGLELTAGVDGYLDSRAAQGATVWSLDFVPAESEKKNEDYVAADGLYSLVISGPKGVISTTPYVYTYTATPAVEAYTLPVDQVITTYNEEGMDIFVASDDVTKGESPYVLPTPTLKGMYILEVVEPADEEKYGITIEGSVVKIANMPKGAGISSIKMKMTAISVNGKMDSKEFSLKVNNEIAATGALADLEETLTSTYKNGSWSTTQTIWWSLDNLKLSALQMQGLVNAAASKLEIKNAEGTVVYTSDVITTGPDAASDDKVVFYEAKNVNKSTTDYKKAAYIKATLTLADENIIPGDYTVIFTAENAGTTILKAESDLTLANPEEELATVKEALLDEDGVAVAVAYGNGLGVFEYDLETILTLDGKSTIATVVDLDRAYDATIYAQWLKIYGTGADAYTASVIAPAMEDFTTTAAETQVDKVHTFKVTYKLFNNPKNTKDIEVKVKWASAVYAENAADVITLNATKLAAVRFQNVAGNNVDERILDLKAAATAIYAQGTKKGTQYKLFGTEESEPTITYTTYKDWTSYDNLTVGTGSDAVVYVKSTSNVFVQVRLQDMATLGYGATEIAAAVADATKIPNLKADDFLVIYNKVSGESDKNGNSLFKWGTNNEFNAYAAVGSSSNITDETVKMYYEMFEHYAPLIKFKKSFQLSTSTDADDAVDRAKEIQSVTFKFVNDADKNYFSSFPAADTDCVNSASVKAKDAKDIDITSLIEDKKVVPMQMIVTDKWGKKMTYEFNVTISL